MSTLLLRLCPSLRALLPVAALLAASTVGAQPVIWTPTQAGTLNPQITPIVQPVTFQGLGFNSVSQVRIGSSVPSEPIEAAFGDALFIIIEVPEDLDDLFVRLDVTYRTYFSTLPSPGPALFGPDDAIDIELTGPGGVFPADLGSSQVDLTISTGALRVDATRTIDNPLVGNLRVEQLAEIAPNLNTFLYYRPTLVFTEVPGATLPAGLVVELEVRGELIFVPEPSAAAAWLAALGLCAGLYRRHRLARSPA